MTVTLSDVVLRDLLRPLNNLNDASALYKYLQSFYTLRKVAASLISTYKFCKFNFQYTIQILVKMWDSH